jgi:hypothetical protein
MSSISMSFLLMKLLLIESAMNISSRDHLWSRLSFQYLLQLMKQWDID